MDVGVGLPTTIPGTPGSALLDWARRAEGHGFASLGVLDRLVYDNYEPLVSLAAAAAVTSRIRLATTILIAAYRDSAAVLAKQAASIHALSGGRLVLGVAAGGREDDFATAGSTYHDRGRRLDAMLTEIRHVWADERVGPRSAPDARPPVLVGGHSPEAMARVARLGDGWVCGGSSGTGYPELVARLRAAWAEHGRAGEPRLVAIGYVSLGPGGRERAEAYLRPYYAHIGPHAERVVAGVLTDGGRLRDHLAAYEEAGCDEMILFPCADDPGQVDLIAKAVW